MDEISVFRRFFVVQNLITEILGALTGAGTPQSSPANYQVTSNPAQETDVQVPSSLGNSNTISGTRPPSSRRRRRPPPPPLENTVRHPFPTG